MNLTDADDDGTRFVTGSQEINNYVWYSGKLWRIVGINSDGSIKLITEGNVTTIAWNTTTNVDYSTSQVRNWLNQEFLPTLYNADNLIVSHNWDYTTDSTADTNKPETTSYITDKVGLLTIYEVMVAGKMNGYLNNGGYWWYTMSPANNTNIHIIANGPPSLTATSANSIRPAINLKNGISVEAGSGTREKPYVLSKDKNSAQDKEFLNTRISGEYIKFNNVLYRIVGIEEINGQKFTKVAMTEYTKNSMITNQRGFGETSDVTGATFNINNGIGKYLNDWYNATSSNENYSDVYLYDNYKNMIATSEDGIVWHQGPEEGVGYDYTLAKTGTAIYATIGLSSYGEMFASQLGDNSNNSPVFWLMTRYSDVYVWNIMPIYGNSSSNLGYPASVRPSFYLKSNVVIGDTDGDGAVGTGKPNDPYEIVQLTE